VDTLHDISMDLSIFQENMFCKAGPMEVAFLVKCWLHCSCFLRVGVFTPLDYEAGPVGRDRGWGNNCHCGRCNISGKQ
jgi:hypothetical protein